MPHSIPVDARPLGSSCLICKGRLAYLLEITLETNGLTRSLEAPYGSSRVRGAADPKYL
jgi:hypothetical protein